MNVPIKEVDGMGLMKVTGLPVTVVEKDYRMHVDPPEVAVQTDGTTIFKSYAAQLLSVTALTDPTLLDKVREAAEKITTPDEKPWTQDDARIILESVGVPPSPSLVQVQQVPGQGMLLLRSAAQGGKGIRKVRYKGKQPNVSLLRELRAENVTVAEGTCMEVPVKLVEGEEGLMLALFLRRQRTRQLSEVEGQEAAK
jgi:hypothetical protein